MPLTELQVPGTRYTLLCTRKTTLATLGRRCPEVTKIREHSAALAKGKPKRAGESLEVCQRFVEALEETGMIRGTERLHRGHATALLDTRLSVASDSEAAGGERGTDQIHTSVE